MTFVTRFAPSPTGLLHLGHAYSALLAHHQAREAGGAFHLRMDDIDQSRSRAHWAAQIQQDLTWLGIEWDGPIWSQHARENHYKMALQTLWNMGVLYVCTCSRRDVKDAVSAPQEGVPLLGPDGVVYPGTCRTVPSGNMDSTKVLRLNIRKATQAIDNKMVRFFDHDVERRKTPDQMISEIGDVVLARKDMAAAYHLAIVVDDADHKITHVIRGEDLREATFIHVLLQKLLGYSTPNYFHHPLIRDETGKRLAKRDDARAIAKYREDGLTPNDVRRLVGL